jgi:hypothetical protein
MATTSTIDDRGHQHDIQAMTKDPVVEIDLGEIRPGSGRPHAVSCSAASMLIGISIEPDE